MPDSIQKTVLITGCSSGIGLATAIALRQKGYVVVATARRDEALQRLADQQFIAIRLDLRDSESIRCAVAAALAATGGRLDYLINNAGYSQPGAIEDLSRHAMREIFETNVLGLIELTNAVLPLMRAQRFGKIIQISSVLGIVAVPYKGVYCATKHAMEAISDALRLELDGTGIQISIVQLGPVVDTRLAENSLQALQAHIDSQSSPHLARYRMIDQRMREEKSASIYSTSAAAVAQKIVKIVEKKSLKIRYRITMATTLTECLRRVLPYRFLDFLIRRWTQESVK